MKLTHDEKMFGTISYNRLIDLISAEEAVVEQSGRDWNSYGEFRFIYLFSETDEFGIVAYGHGEHEYRERYFVETWGFYHYHTAHGTEEDKQKLLQQLSVEHAEYIELEKARETPSEIAETYSLIADLADDDFALSEMEDMELL
jgi:hypothetical protein